MNVYLIFEFRRVREKREREFAVFRVMFRVNREYDFLSNLEKLVIEKNDNCYRID